MLLLSFDALSQPHCNIWRYNVEASLYGDPTPSKTMSQVVLMVGTVSVFGSKHRFLIHSARSDGLPGDGSGGSGQTAVGNGADVLVSPFNDPIGRDVVIQWPGGVNMQLYWHATAPSYKPLQTIPENRVYVSAERVAAFVQSFLSFSNGRVVSDAAHAPGVEIGRPNETYRRVRIESNFGKLTVLLTDGQVPYTYGLEINGYEL
jgi:hypothetical protein